MLGGIQKRMGLALIFLCLGGISACTFTGQDSVNGHYLGLSVPQPRTNSLTYCHGYGCYYKTKFRFTLDDIAHLKSLFEPSETKDFAAQEREGIAKAVAWFEQRAGKLFGTAGDRPRTDMSGMGDRTQLDCVDEATNSTSLLLFLEAQGFLQYHTIKHPIARNNAPTGPNAWLHYGALLVQKETGKRYVVDSWPFSNGSRPAILPVEKWYNSTEPFKPQPYTAGNPL